ncbi:MAG: hypothetical protein EXS36_12365 [Pedosphaera sp.]|nr:hypothetical protein [Pedosphaera sp.]
MGQRSRRRSNSLLRWLLVLLLLPFCVGATLAILRVIRSMDGAFNFWAAFLSGVVAWLLLFVNLPKPMWIYVVGHELTHALGTWAFGGRVRRFKASPKGGHVVITRSNFVVSLAPYFFPLYAVLWWIVFYLGDWLWKWDHYLFVFHFGLGMAYAFHGTLTAHILRIRQPDLEGEGWVFSTAVIWLGNGLVLLMGLAALSSSVSVLTALAWFLQETGAWVARIGSGLH